MIPAYEFYSCGLHINFVSSHFQVLQEFLWTMLNLSQNYDHKLHSPSDTIHSISGCPYSANDFEFSAKQLAENAETIKVSLFPEIKLDYHSIMFSHRLNLILIHTEYILNKMTLWHNFFGIWMIYWKADFFHFLNVWVTLERWTATRYVHPQKSFIIRVGGGHLLEILDAAAADVPPDEQPVECNCSEQSGFTLARKWRERRQRQKFWVIIWSMETIVLWKWFCSVG